MALTQVSTQGIKDGTITGSDLATNIDLVDSQRIRIGTSNDLEIFHNGNFNFIVNNNNKNLAIQAKDGENAIVTIPDAEVQLYHNNSLKFETTSTGVTVTGQIISDGLNMGDSEMIKLGSSNDLLIYHNGSDSYVQDDGTGKLVLSTNGARIDLYDNTNVATLARFITGGSVELYEAGNKKFETTSVGVHVLGTFEGDNLKASNPGNNALLIQNPSNGIIGFGANNQTNQVTISTDGHLGIPSDSGRLRLGASEDFQIYHDGSNSYIANTTGTLLLQNTGTTTVKGSTVQFENAAGTEVLLKAIQNGAVELYHDNSKKFETTSDGVTVTGDLRIANDSDYIGFGTGNDLQIRHDGTNSKINNSTGDLIVETDSYAVKDQASNEFYIKAVKNGGVELYYDNDRVFYTETRGVRIGDNTKIFENSSHNTAIMQHADIHHAIIFRGSSNANGSTITNTNVTTFREYGNFVFMTGAINMGTRLTIAQNGNIGAPSGTNIYNASDSRLKKNVVTLDKGLDVIKALRPVSFNWIDGFCDEEKDTLYGFVAQEAQTVDSNLVSLFGGDVNIGDDPENPDQTITDPLRVNEKYIVPILVKAIQELTAKVEALETEVAALKAS